jgi:hypothetical protein
MGNRASPLVRCDYPSHTSAVYSRSCISTARSYTQYNLSSILQSFNPSCIRAVSHRNSYEPGCTSGLFSPATAAFVPLHLSCTLLHRVHPRRTCPPRPPQRTCPPRPPQRTCSPRPPQRTSPPRPSQRTCYRVYHNAPVTASTTTHCYRVHHNALLPRPPQRIYNGY